MDLTYDPEKPGVAISPDGRQVVFVGASEGRRLYLLDLEQPEDAVPIAGTEGARSPFVSPDGAWVAFEANRKLLKVSLNGGDAVELADVPHFRGGTWSQDAETIYYTPDATGGLSRVSSDGGGQPETISKPDRDGYDMEHEWPDILPGGARLLYSSCCFPERIMVFDLETGQRHQLIENGFFPRYVSTGHILFARGGSLLAAHFDPVSLEVGTPEEILGNLVTGNDHPAEYAVSRSGDLVYLSGISDAERVLVRVDATGTVERLVTDAYVDPMRISLSPDGQRLALSMRRGPGGEALANVSQADVYVYDLVRGTFDRLTLDPRGDWNPIWTSNGRDVVFQSVRGGPSDLYIRPADRSAPATLLYASDFDKWPRSWSPDGKLLAFEQRGDPATGSDTWIYSTEDPDNPKPFLTEMFNEENPAFSPDGRWLAYQSDELGQFEIHSCPIPVLVRPAGCPPQEEESHTGPGMEQDSTIDRATPRWLRTFRIKISAMPPQERYSTDSNSLRGMCRGPATS